MRFALLLIILINNLVFRIRSSAVVSTEYTPICNINPLDDQYTSDFLLKNSRPLDIKRDAKILLIINLFFRNTSETLRNRVRIMKNSIQFGVSVFYKTMDFAYMAYVTFNPNKVASLSPKKEEAISYLLIHALSHIFNSDILIHEKNIYSNWHAEIDADKNTGAQIAKIYHGKFMSLYFYDLLHAIMGKDNVTGNRPPVTVRSLAALAGYLEIIEPRTYSTMFKRAMAGVSPSEKKGF